jgi:Antibiotic biosynthesis monooxygenase
MFVHIWRMRARKKRVEDYEKFGRQVTLPSLKKIDGCLGAHFIRLFQSRKPEYLWLVFWRDHKALEQARTNPLWREQIKRFEAGKYYKSIPLEFVCESVESFSASLAKPKRATKQAKSRKASLSVEREIAPPAPEEEPPELAAQAEEHPDAGADLTAEGE